MGRLTVREYGNNVKREIVELLKRGLTERFALERWNWLHRNDVRQESNIVVIEYDGKIVSTVGAIKKRFQYNAESLVGDQHIDDGSMRGKGVFSRMIEGLNEISTDVNFGYTFPKNPSLRGFAKYGYRSIGPIYI